MTGVQTCALPIYGWRMFHSTFTVLADAAAHLRVHAERLDAAMSDEIGRASCRERVFPVV